MAQKSSWYLRRNGKVEGPYPAGLVSRYILLGRLHLTDFISSDNQEWIQIKDVPEIIPQILNKDLNDPFVRDRLLAARRWADERIGRDRRDGTKPSAEILEHRSGLERRKPEVLQLVDHRLKKNERSAKEASYSANRLAIGFIFVFAAVIGILAYNYVPPKYTNEPLCTAPAMPRVNWSNCKLEGMKLEYIDLTEASMYSSNLTGANLRGSVLVRSNLSYATLSIVNLQGANLRDAIIVGATMRNVNLTAATLQNANLAYADLAGAHIDGADFSGAKLDHAIWVDGRTCAASSIGECRLAPQ